MSSLSQRHLGHPGLRYFQPRDLRKHPKVAIGGQEQRKLADPTGISWQQVRSGRLEGRSQGADSIVLQQFRAALLRDVSKERAGSGRDIHATCSPAYRRYLE